LRLGASGQRGSRDDPEALGVNPNDTGSRTVRYRSSTVRPEVDRTNRDLLDFERDVVEVAIVDIRLIIEFPHGGLAETLFRRKASTMTSPDPVANHRRRSGLCSSLPSGQPWEETKRARNHGDSANPAKRIVLMRLGRL
jgi:hypothetical protein